MNTPQSKSITWLVASTQFALGLILAYAIVSILAIFLVTLMESYIAGWVSWWAKLGFLERLLINLPGVLLVLLPAWLFWRRRRLVAIGMLAFLGLDLAVGLIEMFAP